MNNQNMNNQNLNTNNTNAYQNTPNANTYNPYANAGYTQAAPQVQPQPQVQNPVDPMAAVASLNKEEAMEEALSHTNQYTPFEVPKQEVATSQKTESSKSAYILMIVIIVIMALFIIFLPQISKLFGW